MVQHLEMVELLAIRDGEGAAFARSHVEECEACRRELDRLYQVRARLRALPTYRSPRELWPRIAQRVMRHRSRRRLAVGGALGLAAAAGLAGILVLGGSSSQGQGSPVDIWVVEVGSQDLGPMIDRSRELESLLEAYTPAYRVYDAPTALAVSVVEDRIMLLDRLLEESRAIGADRVVLRGLWGERVQALETLVGLQLVQEEDTGWR
jgi:hypothetical protein